MVTRATVAMGERVAEANDAGKQFGRSIWRGREFWNARRVRRAPLASPTKETAQDVMIVSFDTVRTVSYT